MTFRPEVGAVWPWNASGRDETLVLEMFFIRTPLPITRTIARGTVFEARATVTGASLEVPDVR